MKIQEMTGRLSEIADVSVLGLPAREVVGAARSLINEVSRVLGIAHDADDFELLSIAKAMKANAGSARSSTLTAEDFREAIKAMRELSSNTLLTAEAPIKVETPAISMGMVHPAHLAPGITVRIEGVEYMVVDVYPSKLVIKLRLNDLTNGSFANVKKEIPRDDLVEVTARLQPWEVPAKRFKARKKLLKESFSVLANQNDLIAEIQQGVPRLGGAFERLATESGVSVSLDVHQVSVPHYLFLLARSFTAVRLPNERDGNFSIIRHRDGMVDYYGRVDYGPEFKPAH